MKAEQPILGIVARSAPKRLTAFQRETMRRQALGGRQPSILSPGQQMTARRRADREQAQREAVVVAGERAMLQDFRDVLKKMPKA